MAKVTTAKTVTYREVSKKKRPGVHSKSKHSNLKASKHYQKAYRGQGK